MGGIAHNVNTLNSWYWELKSQLSILGPGLKKVLNFLLLNSFHSFLKRKNKFFFFFFQSRILNHWNTITSCKIFRVLTTIVWGQEKSKNNKKNERFGSIYEKAKADRHAHGMTWEISKSSFNWKQRQISICLNLSALVFLFILLVSNG